MVVHQRKGFTLLELLVVIAIVGVLATLMVSAVIRVGGVADRAKTKMTADQFGLAGSRFEATVGVRPVLTGGGPNGEFRLCTSYADAQGRVIDWPEAKFLLSAWPRMSFTDNGLRVNGKPVPQSAPILMSGNRCLVFWLTGGEVLSYRGLSNSPVQPFRPATDGEARMKLMDLSAATVVKGELVDSWGTPFAVFAYDGTTRRYPPIPQYGVLPYTDASAGWYNSGGLQVISAGPDRKFGPGGNYTAGEGAWANPQPGEDDISNFRRLKLGARGD